MPLFRNKPITIEAEQFFPDQPLPFSARGPYVCHDTDGFYVTTTHGQRTAIVAGDWIIPEPPRKGAPKFAAYPCKPDVFAARYELA